MASGGVIVVPVPLTNVLCVSVCHFRMLPHYAPNQELSAFGQVRHSCCDRLCCECACCVLRNGRVRVASESESEVANGCVSCMLTLFGAGHAAQLTGHSGPISEISYSGERTLLSAACDGSVRLWDTRTCSCTAALAAPEPSVLTATMAASGTLIAAGYGTTVGFWDIRTGKMVRMGCPLCLLWGLWGLCFGIKRRVSACVFRLV